MCLCMVHFTTVTWAILCAFIQTCIYSEGSSPIVFRGALLPDSHIAVLQRSQSPLCSLELTLRQITNIHRLLSGRFSSRYGCLSTNGVCVLVSISFQKCRFLEVDSFSEVQSCCSRFVYSLFVTQSYTCLLGRKSPSELNRTYSQVNLA